MLATDPESTKSKASGGFKSALSTAYSLHFVLTGVMQIACTIFEEKLQKAIAHEERVDSDPRANHAIGQIDPQSRSWLEPGFSGSFLPSDLHRQNLRMCAWSRLIAKALKWMYVTAARVQPWTDGLLPVDYR